MVVGMEGGDAAVGRGRGGDRPAAAATVAAAAIGAQNGNPAVDRGRRPALAANASREELEDVWNHGVRIPINGSICGYCRFTSHGGGATRFRKHLGGIAGDVRPCLQVPPHVRDAMREYVSRADERTAYNKNHNRRILRNITEPIYIASDDEDEDQPNRRSAVTSKSSHRGSSSGAGSCSGGRNRKRSFSSARTDIFDVDLARSQSPMQPQIDTMFIKGAAASLGRASAKFCHANDIPGRKVDCPYFKAAIKLTQQLGKGVRLPTGRQIDGTYLQSNFEEMEQLMTEFKSSWKDYGVTVMCDSWTGPTMMSIINFMVYSNGRMYFHKSVDASGQKQNADYLYDCIKGVVNEVGAANVVQIVTDNGSNYKKACQKLIEDQPYHHIVWQPCAAHTVNLMLKDIASLDHVEKVVSSAKRMSRFFYNHNRLHEEMKEKIGGELIRPNATRFGTIFIFLQSFWDRQDPFMKWMVSTEWRNSEWNGEEDYYFCYDRLIAREWWDEVQWVLDSCKPLFCLLRYADQQKQSTLSGFLPRMLQARQEMDSFFGNGTDEEKLLLTKIDKRISYLYKHGFMLAGNPIMDWLSNSRSEAVPQLDPLEIAEEIDRFEQEQLSPTNVVLDDVRIDMSGERLLDEPINTRASNTKNFTGGSGSRSKKRKANEKGKGKALSGEEELFASEDDTDDGVHGSPKYADSADSDSPSDDECDDVTPEQTRKPTGAQNRQTRRPTKRIKNVNALVFNNPKKHK